MTDAADAPDGPAVTLQRATGLRYLEFLAELHDMRRPDCYLEVGTNRGHSLAMAQCMSIAIDPAFRLDREVLGRKPELHLFQSTSDDAFASARMAALTPQVDLAFLDGMHLFEYLLRDVMNTERLMAPGGIILLHDTCPHNLPMAGRTVSRGAGGWTGDVWKVLPILAEYRPDLTIRHIGCRPTGLAMISGPWGGNAALDHAYDQIVARYMDLSLDAFGTDRLARQFPLIAPETVFLELVQ